MGGLVQAPECRHAWNFRTMIDRMHGSTHAKAAMMHACKRPTWCMSHLANEGQVPSCVSSKKKSVKIALFSPPSFHDLACPGLTDMHVWWHDDSHTVRKSVQRPFRPPSLYAQSQKLTENEYFWFMPDGSFRAHLLVVIASKFKKFRTIHAGT